MAVGVVIGVGVAVALSKNGVMVSDGPPHDASRTLDNLTQVQRHLRQQAYGPGYTLHREINIEPYLRRAA